MKIIPDSPLGEIASIADSAAPGPRELMTRRILRTVVSVCGLAMLLLIVTGAVNRDADPVGLELLTLAPQPFRVQVDADGRVAPMRSDRVVSQCRWSTRILSIVPEGTWVQKGDVVCVLDSSEIQEYLRARDVILIRSRAALDASVQDEELLKSANERRLTQAEFAFETAKNDFEMYEQGTHPQQVDKLEKDLALLEERLLLAADEQRFTENLWAQGMTSERALEQAGYDLHVVEEQVRQAKASLSLLSRFRHPRNEIQLEFRQNNAEREVLRTEISNSLASTRARLNTLSNERRVSIYQRNVDDARKSLKACTMLAPRDGQVLYANSWSDVSRGYRAIEEGRSVYYEQPVFLIPDESSQKVSVPVHESLVTRLYRGMQVTVTLKGFEQDPIPGEVVAISEYPRSRSYYTPDVRDFWLDVLLQPAESQKAMVRMNMDASVTLTVIDLPEAMVVPRAAVVGAAGVNFVWLMRGADLVPQAVEPGEATATEVQVRSGLKFGDRIAINLTPQQLAALQKHVYDQLELASR